MLLFVLVSLCLRAMLVNAQDWTQISSMTTTRCYSTATLLSNGHVLVAGGILGSGSLSSAETYDPLTGVWTVTGSMTVTRGYHSATLLLNDLVLVAGGFFAVETVVFLSTTETYNSSTGTWASAGPMNIKRDVHTATLLSNGHVLVAGGYNGGVLSNAETYNPLTETWTTTGSMNAPRVFHTATLLSNGLVFIAGGSSDNGVTSLSSAETYNSSLGTWVAQASMISPREYHTATLLSDGQVLVSGGSDGSPLMTAEIYNSETGNWTVTGSMTATREYHTATLLLNGQVLVAGGETVGNVVLNSAETYDPSTTTWTITRGSMATARYSALAVILDNGQVLVAGGIDAGGGYSSSVDLYINVNPTSLPSCCSISQGIYSETSVSSNLQVDCVNCDILTNLGSFSNVIFYNVLFMSIVLTCINCPALVTLGTFSPAELPQAITLTCSNCSSLQSLGNFPFLSSANSLLSLSCVNCPSISALGNFPLLNANAPISVFCANCSATFNVLFPSLPKNQLAQSISFTCIPCSSPSFIANSPIVFVFSGFVPQEISSVAPAASLTFSNAILPASFTIDGLVRIHSLSLVNVVGGSNLDFLAGLDRVDGGILIQNTTFANIDGITTNLALVDSVVITDNPVLCNINTKTFDTVSASPPIISNNGFNTNCSILKPVKPFEPSLVAYSSSTIELTWTLPQQPSVSTTYTLTINGVAFLTFPSWNPVAVPYTVTSLSASSTYTFVLTATLGALIVNSPSLIVMTDSGASSGCLFGYYKSSGSCLPCGVAQFPSNDFLSCLSCPSGTYANASALASSALCQLCPSGTYSSSSQSTQCSSCPSSNYCPLGATCALLSTISASPANETSTSSSTSNGLSLGYIYLIVFFVLAFVAGLVVVIFPKRMRSVILKFAVLIRTPRFLLRVNSGNWRILELPSVIRGLIGFWVLLGVILVTAYQINNFAVNQFGSLSTIQPGTKFSSGQPILSATTTIMNATIVLFASPITCDPSLFSTSSTINGAVSCTNNATTTTFTLITPLSSLPSSSTNLQLTIAANGNLAYSPALQYSFTGLRYNHLNYSVTETIVGGPNTVVTGATTINMAAVATESLDVNGVTLNTGYDFSYISTSAGTSNSPSSSLVISFQLSVPQYFLQVRQVVAISPLTFISAILAIGGGIVTVGTLIAFVISYTVHHWLRKGAGRLDGSAIELVKGSKQDPIWL